MGRCFHRLDGVLMPLLLLLSLGHACTVFDLDPNDPNTSKGRLVPMSKPHGYNSVEVYLRRPPYSKGRKNGHFGFFFQNETQHDVAGVTVMYSRGLTIVSFEGRREGGGLDVVHASFVNGRLFAEDDWVELYVMYENGLFEVQFPTKHPEENPLKYDYPRPSEPREPGSSSKKQNIFHAWVHSQHELPLMMYPVALKGPKQRMTYNCLDNHELELKSTNFVDHQELPAFRGFSINMYMKPESDFEVGTLLLNFEDSPHQMQIAREDVLIGQRNPIFITSHWGRTTVIQVRERRCLKRTVIRNSEVKLESLAFFADSAFKWIFQPERGVQGFLRCDEGEDKACHDSALAVRGRPTDSERKWLGTDTQLKKFPEAEDDLEADFSIWFQEVDLTVAGVRVREVGLELVLDFYQVVNGTSYVLQRTVTLEDFQLRSDAWTPLMTKIEEDYIEVGFKGDRWFTARGEMALDHQISLMTFHLSSRRPLLVRYDCGEEPLSGDPVPPSGEPEPPSEGPLPPKRKILERLSFAKIRYPEAGFLLRPVTGFKTASLFVVDTGSRNTFMLGDVTEEDVVMDTWNVITFSHPEERGYLPSVQRPSRGNCSVAWKVAHPYFAVPDTTFGRKEILFYSNVPLEWKFDDLPEKEDVVKRYTCGQNLKSVCSVRVVGHDSFTPLQYEEGMSFWLRSSNYHKFGFRMSLRDFDRDSQDIEFHSYNGSFHVFSMALYMNETLQGFQEGLRVSLSGLSGIGLVVTLETTEDGLKRESQVHARVYYYGDVEDTWVSLFPLAEEMSLEVPGHFSENITNTPTQTRTEPYVLKDTEVLVAFRSRLSSDHITSISLVLYAQDWKEIQRPELVYSRHFSYLRHELYLDPLHLGLALEPTKWTEMVLKASGTYLIVGVRASSDEDFQTKKLNLYQELYFVALESMHSHEVMVNCKREDDRMVLETGQSGAHPLVSPPYLFVGLKKLNEVNIPVNGADAPEGERKCSLIFVSYYNVSLGVMYLHHRSEKVSAVFFNGTSFGRLNAVVLHNAGVENGVAMVTLPAAGDQEAPRQEPLQHEGPVDRVTVYTDYPALWITPVCTCSQEELSLPKPPADCESLNSTDAQEPFMTSRSAPTGDFLVLLEHSSPHPVTLVHLVHDSGEISSRNLVAGHFREKTSWFQVRNAPKKDDFAFVKFVSDLGPDFVKLRTREPVKELRFFSPSGPVCVSVVRMSCQ